ncbi:MAG: histidine kinase, partial [Hungatella sp.]
RYISLNIERQLENSEQLLGWITYNQRLENILTTNYSQPYEKQLDIIEFASYVTEYAINANIESNIFKILIMAEDGSSFQMGNGYSLLDKDAIVESHWMEDFYGIQADHLILSKDIYMKDTYVFPISSRIYQNSTGKPLGWCLVVLYNDMYSKHLTTTNQKEHLFLLNQQGQCIGHTDSTYVGEDLSKEPLVRKILSSRQKSGNITGSYQGIPSILHYYQVPSTHMVEVQTAPLEDFLRERRNMSQLAALFIFFTMFVILFVAFYLRNKLIRPIHIITDYIREVPENGFEGNMEFKGDDEFKQIADSINTMECEIKELIEDQQREANIKKDLEFKVLQNQINPHFLYNTLNCIKWMASLQHADTIRDMTSALGRLLQNIAKGTESKIPIYEEMSLLDDYVLIQDIKYDGKIKVQYHIGDNQITQAYIIKFLFQPIVENAIFHGIEPNSGMGRIDIDLQRQGEDIFIHIRDDGVGMTEEQIDALLHPQIGVTNSRGLNGVGISNIQERISMTYGNDYGLTITSKLLEYTDVTIKIPYEKEGFL